VARGRTNDAATGGIGGPLRRHGVSASAQFTALARQAPGFRANGGESKTRVFARRLGCPHLIIVVTVPALGSASTVAAFFCKSEATRTAGLYAN